MLDRMFVLLFFMQWKRTVMRVCHSPKTIKVQSIWLIMDFYGAFMVLFVFLFIFLAW